MRNLSIGVFDSGKGGLTILSQLKKSLSQEQYIYYGDLAHIPFGIKSNQEIIDINREVISFLIAEGVKIIVLACNTSSAVALPTVRQEFSQIPIIGIIETAARQAVTTTQNKKIGIFATQATVNSHAYQKAITAVKSNCQVIEQACPEFVPIVESNQIYTKNTEEIVEKYCRIMSDQKVDTLIHGCTHYPYLEPIMKKFLPKVNFVNPADGTAVLVKKILQELNLFRLDKEINNRYIVSKIDGGQYVRIDGREQLLGSPSAN